MHPRSRRMVLLLVLLSLAAYRYRQRAPPAEPGYKWVLLWNTYWSSRAGWSRIFRRVTSRKCPEWRCAFTSDRSLLSTSHAVLFHAIDLHRDGYRLPPHRAHDQHWVLMTYEPPFVVRFWGVNLAQLDSVGFNRTMSYRRDSDVVVSHGRFFGETAQETEVRPPAPASDWVDSRDARRDYSRGKKRLVAWFLSSHGCKSQSGREMYVHELKRYVPVDVYGACGMYKCGASKTIKNPYQLDEDDCYLIISRNYKFYLALENSICRDYVTEKLYNSLRLNVVPIVLGGANYSQVAPPKSVIDASKYSPKELSEYLSLLDRNDSLYNEYFRWKETYRVEGYDSVPDPCDLCAKLHSPNWLLNRKTYANFSHWFLTEAQCKPGYRIGKRMALP